MKISARSKYGLRLMLDLALSHGKKPSLLREIAERQEISEKYLGQIIIPLKAAALVKSFRGARGGYSLSREPGRINLREIVEILEGGLVFSECVERPSVCTRSRTCVTTGVWNKVGQAVAKTLEEITLADLVREHMIIAGEAPEWSI